MKIQLLQSISTSLRSGSSPFEHGDNFTIKITLDEAEWTPAREAEIRKQIQVLDHRHLSDDFGFSDEKDLLVWLKERLRQQGLKIIALELKGSRAFYRFT